jgi:cell shape-determining protein MreC
MKGCESVARNKLIDLNNHLFEQLERLNDDELSEEQLEREIKRTKSMCEIGKVIVSNAAVTLAAQKHFDEYGIETPEMLAIGTSKK